MCRLIRPLVGLTLALACTTPALAQSQRAEGAPSIGYVDVERVAALSSEGKAAAAKLQDLRDRKTAELSESRKQIDVLQQKLSQGASVINDATRLRLQREFQRAQINFQRLTQDAEAEVQDLQQDLMRAFTARLFPVVGDVAKERNLWAVFGSESALLWHNPAIDLSADVAKRLDASPAPKR